MQTVWINLAVVHQGNMCGPKLHPTLVCMRRHQGAEFLYSNKRCTDASLSFPVSDEVSVDIITFCNSVKIA